MKRTWIAMLGMAAGLALLAQTARAQSGKVYPPLPKPKHYAGSKVPMPVQHYRYGHRYSSPCYDVTTSGRTIVYGPLYTGTTSYVPSYYPCYPYPSSSPFYYESGCVSSSFVGGGYYRSSGFGLGIGFGFGR